MSLNIFSWLQYVIVHAREGEVRSEVKEAIKIRKNENRKWSSFFSGFVCILFLFLLGSLPLLRSAQPVKQRDFAVVWSRERLASWRSDPVVSPWKEIQFVQKRNWFDFVRNWTPWTPLIFSSYRNWVHFTSTIFFRSLIGTVKNKPCKLVRRTLNDRVWLCTLIFFIPVKLTRPSKRRRLLISIQGLICLSPW